MSTQDFNNLTTKSSNNLKGKFSAFHMRVSNSFKNKNIHLPRSIKTSHLIVITIVGVLIVSFIAGRALAPQTSFGSKDTRQVAPKPIATQDLNKKFEFPLKDDKGKEVAKISYMVESANIQDSFIYQGKLASAVQGRTFLIFNLKITNPYTKAIEINAKDYIRVKVNGTDEQLAPDIHNDPIQIEPDSTKYTRIGMPINDSDKDIILLVGELKGEKQIVNLNLHR